MATSRWEKDFLLPRDIVSLSLSFIAGKRHQQWGWLYQSLLCLCIWEGSSVQSSLPKEGLAGPRGSASVQWLPGRQMTQTLTEPHHCIHALCAKTHVVILKLMHNQKHACCCTYELSDSTCGDLNLICIPILLHCRISKTLMSTPDWIYDCNISWCLRCSKLSLCCAGEIF